MNPQLTYMIAQERIADLPRTSARRGWQARCVPSSPIRTRPRKHVGGRLRCRLTSLPLVALRTGAVVGSAGWRWPRYW